MEKLSRWTQNPVDRKAHEGSIPSSGTSFPLKNPFFFVFLLYLS